MGLAGGGWSLGTGGGSLGSRGSLGTRVGGLGVHGARGRPPGVSVVAFLAQDVPLGLGVRHGTRDLESLGTRCVEARSQRIGPCGLRHLLQGDLEIRTL